MDNGTFGGIKTNLNLSKSGITFLIHLYQLAGIYIHIPFCKQACYYCNFHFSTSLRHRGEMTTALLREIQLHRSGTEFRGMIFSGEEPVSTLYFGGGTPSILPGEEIKAMIDAVRQTYRLLPDAEITLEANPDDITPSKLAGWRTAGINRLSIGIQSFFDRDLKWMNRSHDAVQAQKALDTSLAAGFDNISADLIFGIPHLTDADWEDNINQLVKRKIPHISCYALTVEPKTALAKMIMQHKKEDIDNDVQARQFEILMQKLQDAGYEHYEISNFALPGHRSRHNSSYWKGEKYLGIGPSAHSYDGDHRYWNIANNALYMDSLNRGASFFEMETLTEAQRFNEYILTTIRTIEGTDLNYLRNHFPKTMVDALMLRLQKLPAEWFKAQNDTVTLTRKGVLLADRITVSLFA